MVSLELEGSLWVEDSVETIKMANWDVAFQNVKLLNVIVGPVAEVKMRLYRCQGRQKGSKTAEKTSEKKKKKNISLVWC